MLFSSLLFILLKLKINFGRVTWDYVPAKKQCSLEISGTLLTAGEEELVEQKWDDFFEETGQFFSWWSLGCLSRGWWKARPWSHSSRGADKHKPFGKVQTFKLPFRYLSRSHLRRRERGRAELCRNDVVLGKTSWLFAAFAHLRHWGWLGCCSGEQYCFCSGSRAPGVNLVLKAVQEQ